MPYVIFYYAMRYYVFSEAATTVLKSFTNSTGKQLCWSLFFKVAGPCTHRCFTCEFCEKFLRTAFQFSYRYTTSLVAASE